MSVFKGDWESHDERVYVQRAARFAIWIERIVRDACRGEAEYLAFVLLMRGVAASDVAKRVRETRKAASEQRKITKAWVLAVEKRVLLRLRDQIIPPRLNPTSDEVNGK